MAGEMQELVQTALGKAITGTDLKLVKKLIHTEDVRWTDRKGNTYLHLVSITYRPYIFHIIASSGININAQNKFGNTALHVSTLQHDCSNVSWLMLYGCNPFIKNKDGHTAADLARQNNHRFWLDIYEKLEPGLRCAILNNDKEKVSYLLHCWSACHLKIDGKDTRHLVASLFLKDILKEVEHHRFSVMAVYAVMESDIRSLSFALSRGSQLCDVNFLQTIPGHHKRHMLQHAIRLGNAEMVGMLCDAGADVNMPVYINEYFKGPLFFESLTSRSTQPVNQGIFFKIIQSGTDPTLKDERGRSILMYAMDKSNSKVDCKIIQEIINRGVDLSSRDTTGCSARDVAALARRSDIVSLIDLRIIDLVKTSNMTELYRLAVNGYHDFLINHKGKDVWIYACGNKTKDARCFIEQVTNFESAGTALHNAIDLNQSLQEIQQITRRMEKSCFTEEMLLQYKDKGGRSPLLKALLYQRYDVIEWVIAATPKSALHTTDNMGRSVQDYCCALWTDARTLFQTIVGGNTTPEDDARCENIELNEDFIHEERNKTFVSENIFKFLSQYERLIRYMKSPIHTEKHVRKALKNLGCPVAELPFLFHPSGSQLVNMYEDLLLMAIYYRRTDTAERLIFHGCDCSVRQKFLYDGVIVWMDARELAETLHLPDVLRYLDKYGVFRNYWNLGVVKFIDFFKTQESYVLNCDQPAVPLNIGPHESSDVSGEEDDEQGSDSRRSSGVFDDYQDFSVCSVTNPAKYRPPASDFSSVSHLVNVV